MDLKNSKVIQSILENGSEGVCTIHADFTPVRIRIFSKAQKSHFLY